MTLAHHYIAHRINQVEELKKVPVQYGVEIDIRPYAQDLVLVHDPYQTGENLEDYLKHYQHGTLILNVKAEAVEYRVLELLKKYNIENYFFLDSSFPMLVKLVKQGEHRLAVRCSEYEGLDTVRAMRGLAQWVWIDCFTHLPLDRKIYRELKQWGYKLCLVSPELQGQAEKINEYREFLMREQITFDAICTKLWNIKQWAST